MDNPHFCPGAMRTARQKPAREGSADYSPRDALSSRHQWLMRS